jgi:hypothetical protein
MEVTRHRVPPPKIMEATFSAASCCIADPTSWLTAWVIRVDE